MHIILIGRHVTVLAFYKELLETNDITLYSTENEGKSSVCERWNRTIETKMWKQFTVQGNTQYLNILPKILSQYIITPNTAPLK